MPLSNATLSVLSSGPYWDDFDKSKRYHRILVRPRTPIQTRELNQMQSLLQNQVEQLGAGIFKEGSAVTGGNFTFANNVVALQIIRDDAVDIANFYNANTGIGTIARGQTSLAEGRVVQIDRQPGDEYTAVLVAPLSADEFAPSEGVAFVDSIANASIATVALAPDPFHVRPASVFSVEDGVFFLRGALVEVDQQTLVLSSSSGRVTARVGFIINEEIVTHLEDESLRDPALTTTNYAAPGAHRLKLTATLTWRPTGPIQIGGGNPTFPIQQSADEDFIEIARIIDGVLTQSAERTVPTLIEDSLARRTYDESGDYVISPFALTITEHNPPVSIPNATGTISGNTSSTTIISPNNDTLFLSEVTIGDSIIVNGESREVTTITSDIALSVMSPFSAPFTDTTFVVASESKLTLELDAGKAYIRGYEFETLGPTKISVDRPRTTANVSNIDVGTFFGPYVFVTRANGELLNISTMQRVDLHSVSFASVNTTANTYASSKIGTAHARSTIYYSGNGDANTVYKLYLVNAEFANKTYTITGNANSDVSITGVTRIANTTGNFITLTHNASAVGRSLLPTGNLAYAGAKVTLFDTLGGRLDYIVVQSVSNTVSTVVTNILQVTSNAFFDVINTSANVSITFTDKCIRGITNANTKTSGATVSVLSKLGNIETGNTVLFGADQTSLIFPFQHRWVKANTIFDETFQGVRYFSAVSSSGSNATHTDYTLTLPATELFFPIITPATNFVVANASGLSVQLTSATEASLGMGGAQATLSIPTTLVGSGDISAYARVRIVDGQPRTKTLFLANTNLASVNVSGAILTSNLANPAISGNSGGHIAINTINTASSRIIGLGVADVYNVQKVYAVDNVASFPISGYTDVTSRYTLDNGQRDWCYDHASLVLKPGYGHSDAGKLLVMVDRFQASGNGYFTAESYIGSGLPDDYVDIPTFVNPKSGKQVALRDCIDFRPIRSANTSFANTANNPYVNTVPVFEQQVFPFPEATFQSDYEFYLPRVDKVVLTKDREFRVLSGIPAVAPAAPSDIQEGITMYVVTYPPYVVSPEVVQYKTFEYRRYTMKDIGKLEKRIENLEYYVQLSLLEQQTLNTPEFDDSDLERFKNGILVDPFSSFAVADIGNPDYAASMDFRRRELRPAFYRYGWKLGGFVPGSSVGVKKIGTDFVTVNYNEDGFIRQPLASKSVNINPFNVASWAGTIHLRPSSDTWFDEEVAPEVRIDLFDQGLLPEGDRVSLGVVWNDWETQWLGTSTSNTVVSVFGAVVPGQVDPRAAELGRTREQWVREIEVTTTTTGTRSRSGEETFAQYTPYEVSLGNRVVDVSVAPYIRRSNIIIEAQGMKPGAQVLAFFDDVDVTNHVDRANEVVLVSNAAAAAFTIGEDITTVGGASAVVAGITGNILRIVDAFGVFLSATITGQASGATATVQGYMSASGYISSATNPTTLILGVGSSPTTSDYVGNTIFITSGVGVGQRSVITAYNGGTRTATIFPALSGGLPNSDSTYSIGVLRTDGLPTAVQSQVDAGGNYFTGVPDAQTPGTFYGLFRVPSGQFLTGTRTFKLSDSASLQESSTHASGRYEANGFTRHVENTTVATRNIEFITEPRVNPGEPISTSSSQTIMSPTGLYLDPLAQTFLVDGSRYAHGVVLSSVDLFFAKKDNSNLPVTVQIRPTVNGYPSADEILAQVVLNGSAINVVPAGVTPSIDAGTHRTRFTFDRPVILMPGVEYSIVILTNSFAYEVFVGEVGAKIIGDTRIISEQPYGGSFFKSQNARTWTAEQNEDLMFVLNRAVFSSNTATARFQMNELATEDFPYDILNIQTGHLEFTPTVDQSKYMIRTTDAETLTLESFQTVGIDQNLDMDRERVVLTGNVHSIQFEATMGTSNDAIAPIYDIERMSAVTIENLIDNGGLVANGFVVIDTGVMTSPSAGEHVLTITGGNGTGAVAYANTNSSGYIVSFRVEDPGSGYTETPTVTLSSGFSPEPILVYNGETNPRAEISGEKKARYITRRVTLADGFDASDLKVYFTGSRPTGTNIDVYYKVLATGDTERFDDKPWTRMTINPNQESKFSAPNKFLEYEYKTINNSASYTVNGTEFSRFGIFAIKVVLRSDDPTVVPRLKNLRVIALDE